MKLLTIAVLATGVTLTVGPVTGLLAQTDSAARPAVAAQETGSDAGLQDWLTAFRARALAAGIDGAVFDRAMQTVRYDTEVIRRDRNQSEFTKTIWDYLETATSDLRIANGKRRSLNRQMRWRRLKNAMALKKRSSPRFGDWKAPMARSAVAIRC